jgi:beta-lactamase class A
LIWNHRQLEQLLREYVEHYNRHRPHRSLGQRAPGDCGVWGTGVLRYLQAGLGPTLDDLAWFMIIVSDNVATSLLMQQVGGPAEVNETTAALGLPTARMNPDITLEGALGGEPFATSTPRDLAEAYTHIDEPAKQMLFRQHHLSGLPRRLPHAADASDLGITMPMRVYNKTGNGLGNCVDSGLFETDAAAWVIAAMATDQPDFASRPDDLAPMALGAIGKLFYTAWCEAK